MRVLCSAAIFCFAVSAFLNYASAYELRKREATALADPKAEPGVAKKVAAFCNETMENATSPKDFCKSVSLKVVEKVNGMCVKAVKFTCKVFTGDTKRNCKEFLYSHLCPTSETATIEPNLNSVEADDDDDDDNVTPEVPEDVVAMVPDASRRRRRYADPSPSLESYATRKCESKMEPVFKSIKSEGEFEYVEFCKGMRASVKNACVDSLLDMCNEAPWKPVQFVCKEYLAPWICK